MKILHKVLDEIHTSIPVYPPETGGIFGCSGDCIDFVAFDSGKNISLHVCSYVPDVSFLNMTIRKWADLGIVFAGIFHTHFANVRTLSKGDMKYIEEILRTVSDATDWLYFPVYVLPDRELIAYKAYMRDDRIIIMKEDLIIV